MNLLKKITPKTVKANNVGDSYSLYGYVKQSSIISTHLGNSIRFAGMFRAVHKDGTKYDGMSAYIPGGYDQLVAQQLAEAQDVDKNATLEVAIHFEKVAADNPMGSEWKVTLLNKEQKGLSSLDALETKALPSPKSTVTKGKAAKSKKAA